MSNILKWIAAAVVLLFSSTALCGDPDWPGPPEMAINLLGDPDWPEPPGVVELEIQVIENRKVQ